MKSFKKMSTKWPKMSTMAKKYLLHQNALVYSIDSWRRPLLVKEKSCWISLRKDDLIFYERLIENGWMCFAEEPIKENYTIVREFYANAAETDFSNDLVVQVGGKLVLFDPELINEYYNLYGGDNDMYDAKARELGTY
ncbi:hypothetical protein RND71_012708 [Anisodus tanguticus]|uniref:Uncharacterized protein n=1 Tax=Anisodus tanguticus TaxID=243964 RepID=A0AAE1SHK9_9SOLA|nr:hypothetical protein RND71_012708 [Anisodus tanguticus]